MLKVSEELYASFDVADFYGSLTSFLEEATLHPEYRAALADRAMCERLWDSMFDAQCDRMELALRHAHALGTALREESGGSGADTMSMKADLDNWGYFAFSTFDEEGL